MRIDIISIFPDMFTGPFSHSIIKRAIEKGLAEIHLHDLRDYTTDKHRSVDDYAFGGGAGMVMSIEPIARCIEKLKAERDYDEIIFLTPDGELLRQGLSNELSMKGNLMMLCGHYKGVDERLRELYISMEISIGDYVLTNGVLSAAVVIDAVARLRPGVLGGGEVATEEESFSSGLLEYPQYTRPPEFRGMKVPEILFTGDHAKIAQWRHKQALKRTAERRSDLLVNGRENSENNP